MTSPCTHDSSSITLNTDTDGVSLIARLRTSADPGNRVDVHADGVYLPKTNAVGAAGTRMSDLTLYGPFNDGEPHYFLDGHLPTTNPSGDPMYGLALATWDPIFVFDGGAANAYQVSDVIEVNGSGVTMNDGVDPYDSRDAFWSGYAFPTSSPLNQGPLVQPGMNLRFFSVAAGATASLHWFRFVQRTQGSTPFYVIAHSVKAGLFVAL